MPEEQSKFDSKTGEGANVDSMPEEGGKFNSKLGDGREFDTLPRDGFKAECFVKIC
jgi:hypothetical protein